MERESIHALLVATSHRYCCLQAPGSSPMGTPDPMGFSLSLLATAFQSTCVCAAAVSDTREPRAVESPRRRREARVGGVGGRAGRGRRGGGGRGRAGCARLLFKPLRILFEHMLPQILDDVDVQRFGHEPGHVRLQPAVRTTGLQPGYSLGTAWMHGLQRRHPKASAGTVQHRG